MYLYRSPEVVSRAHERGAVLVVSLLLLLVMTLLALGASQSTRLQERMAGSARNHDLALQSAEAGLRAGERYLGGLSSAPLGAWDCSSGRCRIYERGDLTDDLGLTYEDQAFKARTWWTARAWDYASSDLIGGAEGLARDDPQYYVEDIGEVCDSVGIGMTGQTPCRAFYRVTTRAEGGTEAAQVVLQSTFAKLAD